MELVSEVEEAIDELRADLVFVAMSLDEAQHDLSSLVMVSELLDNLKRGLDFALMFQVDAEVTYFESGGE